MRTLLNVSWQLLKEGLEPEAAEEMRKWLEQPPLTPEQEAAAERRRKAAENRAAFSDLSSAFGKGR